ncbi:hypothetical protein E1B28_012883 [Marasmius oreades]|uniref:Uncharacterized protein n=1 Tax=Marasmius oreades TaxID=181124 RepID=A0A9P7UP65_9AGAR|nr:uncharacterized protein E1B28_012883 [Marasmius oreades]KAG7088938.1 hypothetical protein E1B28_012883 [Marasmius oreades]
MRFSEFQITSILFAVVGVVVANPLVGRQDGVIVCVPPDYKCPATTQRCCARDNSSTVFECIDQPSTTTCIPPP